MSRNWSDIEVEAIVEDYFNMHRIELTGGHYNKSEHRRILLRKLTHRSHGALNRKRQNMANTRHLLSPQTN